MFRCVLCVCVYNDCSKLILCIILCALIHVYRNYNFKSNEYLLEPLVSRVVLWKDWLLASLGMFALL